MGALHQGHLDLCHKARSLADEVVLSVFVNPTQFGPNEDYSKYPRTLERDCELAEAVGVDIVFAPSAYEMYPRKTTIVSTHEVTERWEGAMRPGHFDGVTTVVCKLLNIVQPTVSVFGWKDAQQCATIQRMVADLNMPVEIVLAETTREPDGLAMSSRNAYLSPNERQTAPELNRALKRIVEDGRHGRVSPDNSCERERNFLSSLGFVVDYIAYVDLDTFDPLIAWKSHSIVLVAARIGNTRLIDNERL